VRARDLVTADPRAYAEIIVVERGIDGGDLETSVVATRVA
jgi:hypothetical protein